jgi:imidazolonepropionase-like amidohydrolase
MSRLVASTFAAIFLATGTAAHAGDVLVLRGATVYVAPETAPLHDTNVVVRDGAIVAVGQDSPAAAPTLDCRGLVIVAGLHNNHVHFIGPEWAGAAQQPADALAAQVRGMLTRFGFTSVFDTGSKLDDTLALRKRIDSGEVAGPRILTAGEPLYPPDGIPIYLRDLPPELLRLMKEPATPNEAVEAVDANLGRGADAVKLFTGSIMGGGKVKPMPVAIAQAAVTEAHRLGRPVFAHPSNVEGATIAVESGVDVLAHTNSQGWTPALVASMLAHHTALIPTLKLWPYEAAKESAGADETEAFTAEAINELTAFMKGGGEVLFGTDVGYMRDFDPADEYALMARAGMTPMQILASLTTAPAARFHAQLKLGRVAVGYKADLAVLAGDPATDIRAFAHVRYTLRNGHVVYDAGAQPSQ